MGAPYRLDPVRGAPLCRFLPLRSLGSPGSRWEHEGMGVTFVRYSDRPRLWERIADLSAEVWARIQHPR